MFYILEQIRELIPILIPLLWFISLISRRRKKAKLRKSERTIKKHPPKPVNGESSRPLNEIPTLPEIFAQAREMDSSIVGNEEGEGRSSTAESLREPIDFVTEPAQYKQELKNPSVEPVKTLSSLERIEKLNPLAKGMIWSFILDKPRALKDT